MELSIALLPAFIHVYIFILESVLWGRRRTNRVFGVKAEDVSVIKPWAFNQGFYNLFLAVAILFGLHLRTSQMTYSMGTTLVIYGLLSICGAGLVLFFSAPRRMWKAALIQFLPAALALLPYLRS